MVQVIDGSGVSSAWVVTVLGTVIADSAEDVMSAKLLVLYGQPTDPAAFDAHFTDQHLPLVKVVPGMQSARASTGPVGTPDGPSPYYRVATYTWSTVEELQQGLGSPQGAAAAGDLANFATGGATLLVFEDEEV